MSNESNRRTMSIVAACTASIVCLALLWMARMVLLVLFAGVIGALILSELTDWCQAKLKLRRSLALTVVIATLLALVGLGVWLRGPSMLQQFSDLQTDLPAAARQLVVHLQDQAWGRWLLSRYANGDQWAGDLSFALTRIGGAVMTSIAVLGGMLVVAAVGLYIAAEPDLYLGGLFRITPDAYQAKVAQGLSSAAQMLRIWLKAKALSMLFIAVFVSAGLWLLGIPMAGTLGIIAGLLTFVPNLGPVLSFLPAALLAFAVGPSKGVLTLLVFCMAHLLEGNLVTPLLERQIATLPPALTLAAQLVLATLAGALGVALAAPLTAVVLGVLRVVYPPRPDHAGSDRLSESVASDLVYR